MVLLQASYCRAVSTVKHVFSPPTRRRQARSDRLGALGPWRIECLLGAGTLTRVYAARHRATRASAPAAYALKVLRPKWCDYPQVVELLRHEVFVASRVRHPNVISILDARLDEPPYYLVMPRLAGDTLAARLHCHVTLPPAVALWVARQTSQGLAAIWSACEVTHGDVKPSNLFLSPQLALTILDLGFARSAGEDATSIDWPTLGSLAYAAPETLASVLAADFRSDIYSLGVVLYQMISGKLPHDANSPQRLIEAITEEQPMNLLQLRPDLPRPVAELVHSMLAKDPLRRPQGYAELIERLVRLEIDCFANR